MGTRETEIFWMLVNEWFDHHPRREYIDEQAVAWCRKEAADIARLEAEKLRA